MNFHIPICILHHLRDFYELTMCPAPSWLDSLVGRALYPYRRGHGFKSRSGLIFFQVSISTTALAVCMTAMIHHIFISSFMNFHDDDDDFIQTRVKIRLVRALALTNAIIIHSKYFPVSD